MRIGAHVEQSDAIAQARGMGADVAQVFLGDPQRWDPPEFTYPGGAEALRDDAAKLDLALVVHAPYVINLASPNNRIRIPSRKLLQQQLVGAAQVGATGLVVHGGHVGRDGDLDVGVDAWRKAIESLDPTLSQVPILVENTAGGEGAMARSLERIAALWDVIAPAAEAAGVPLGFCLDTCHAWGAGLDLRTVVADVRAITGRIDLVHCNNSRDEPGSGADRHAGLAKGTIDPEVLTHIVVDADAPVVCETHDDAKEDVHLLRGAIV